MYQEILYGTSIVSGGIAYLLKYHKENNNVKRPECHQAQDRMIDTFNNRIDDLKDTVKGEVKGIHTRFEDLKDFINKNGNGNK